MKGPQYPNPEVGLTGDIAIAMAALARRQIGPDGTMMRVPEEDAPLVRATFISQLAEAAMKILDAQDGVR
ncbi:hypothetical protein SEA_SPOOKY_71 [Gordonia phage Spooky]|nr:hypothetical protein SEA_SPOOKY_71 [Gordonia phage Spooky]